MKIRPKRRFTLEKLEARNLLAAELYQDLLQGNEGTGVGNIVTVGADIYIGTQNGIWKSNGQEAGTSLVVPIAVSQLTSFGGKLFFSSSSGSTGTELWVSDGTNANTVMWETYLGPRSGSPTILGSSGGLLYFVAGDQAHGRELWRTDGTHQGTFLVADLAAGTRNLRMFSFADFNGKLAFIADDGTGKKLYQTSGASNDVTVIRTSVGSDMAVYNNRLYFSAFGSGTGQELWSTDGTIAGTVLFRDLKTGNPSSQPSSFAVAGSRLYFKADGMLWTSTGTPETTVSLPSLGIANQSNVEFQTAVGPWLYYIANRFSSNQELWRTNGTLAGTTLLRTFSRIGPLVNVNSRLYFAASTPESGNEIWRSNGTAAGTVLLKDIYVGVDSSYPTSLTNINGKLYFAAEDLEHGKEVWTSDGTLTGTKLLKDMNTRVNSSDVKPVAAVNSNLLVEAAGSFSVGINTIDTTTGSRQDFGFENISRPVEHQGQFYFLTEFGTIWRTDGTRQNTSRVVTNRNLRSFQFLEGVLYYLADESPGVAASQLRRFDGTTDSLVMRFPVRSNPGVDPPNAKNLTVVGGKLLFQAYSELWATDGTTAGTILLAQIDQWGTISHWPMTVVDDTLYFAPRGLTIGPSLWKSDGTAAGTVQVNPNIPSNLTAFQGQLYFSLQSSNGDVELWRTNRPANGIVRVKDINPGAAASFPGRLTVVGSQLYFVANDGTRGFELWRTDGTEVGTRIVRDLNPGVANTTFTALINANGTLYFGANTIRFGTELWHTDGTAAGTVVEDLVPGTGSSNPQSFVVLGDYLYFGAEDLTHGRELWRTPLSAPIARNAIAASFATPPITTQKKTTE